MLEQQLVAATEDELDEAAVRLIKRLNRLMFKVDVGELVDAGLGRTTHEHLLNAKLLWRQRLKDTE